MTRFTKLLALMPLVALGAACNGLSPTAPDTPFVADEGSSLDLSASADTKATDPCLGISGVELALVPTMSGQVVVNASYRSMRPTSRCAAPVWTSDPSGMLTTLKDPFRAGVSTSRLAVNVTATAPNGVKGQIRVEGRNADLGASAGQCRDITAVDLQQVPSFGGEIVIKATYVRPPSTFLGLCQAPVWASDPRGALKPSLDAYRVGVSVTRIGVTVTATAPNGMRGKIRIEAPADLGSSAAICKDVAAVQLKQVPSFGGTIIEATYVTLGPSISRCDAPLWTSQPRGLLTAQKNPFRVRVIGDGLATVTATAPNGVKGSIKVR